MAKQTNSLPISATLKQPSLMQGGQKRRRRGPEARQSTVNSLIPILPKYPHLHPLENKNAAEVAGTYLQKASQATDFWDGSSAKNATFSNENIDLQPC